MEKLVIESLQEFLNEKEFSSKRREKLASSGKAMDDGSYPIESVQDLKNAIKAFGRAKNKTAAKRHIMKRARALGKSDLIPDNWKVNESVKHLTPKSPEEIEDLKKRGFKLNAGKWKFEIDIEDIYEKASDGEITPHEFVNDLIAILQSKQDDLSGFLEEYDMMSYEDIIDQLQMLDEDADEDEVDFVLNMLYDWADENNVWIKTF